MKVCVKSVPWVTSSGDFEVDQVIAHVRDRRADIDVVRMHIVPGDRVLGALEVIAMDQLAAWASRICRTASRAMM